MLPPLKNLPHFFKEIRSHEWNENQASLMSRSGAGSLPEMLFQNTGFRFSLLREKGEREFWDVENLRGLSLAQTPHYTAFEGKNKRAVEAREILQKNFLKVGVYKEKKKGRKEKKVFHFVILMV